MPCWGPRFLESSFHYHIHNHKHFNPRIEAHQTEDAKDTLERWVLCSPFFYLFILYNWIVVVGFEIYNIYLIRILISG